MPKPRPTEEETTHRLGMLIEFARSEIPQVYTFGETCEAPDDRHLEAWVKAHIAVLEAIRKIAEATDTP